MAMGMGFVRRAPARIGPAVGFALSCGLVDRTPAVADPIDFRDHVATVALTETIPAWGRLGGVCTDRLGYVYVANFHDGVWRVAPDGETRLLHDGLYGASGNAVDSEGNLLQASFFGNTITRIGRDGAAETIVREGLSGPVGLAIGDEGEIYVCNCSRNDVSRVDPDGTVTTFAAGELFSCPNGITRDADGTLYVVNFNNDDVVEITPEGELSILATIPTGGNAHVTLARGKLYVTKITTNRMVRVTLEGEVTSLAGSGIDGLTDGPALDATFLRPNGVATAPGGRALYVNNLVGEWRAGARGRISLRRVDLVNLTDVFTDALAEAGLEAAIVAYRGYKSDAIRGDEPTLTEAVGLGYSYLSSGNAAAAATVFELNAESYPDRAPAQYHLGECYRYTGRTEKALAAYARALAIDPEHRDAAAKKERLERGN